MILYLSRKIGWTFALIFFAVAMGMYFWPDVTRPFLGHATKAAGEAGKFFFVIIKHLLS